MKHNQDDNLLDTDTPLEIHLDTQSGTSSWKRITATILSSILILGLGTFAYINYTEEEYASEEDLNITALEPLPNDQASVAFGDSTMSLADGESITTVGCHQEANNWVERLPDVVNMSCPGADIEKTIHIINKSQALKEQPTQVLLTIGTNTLRNKGLDTELDRHLDTIVNTIHRIAPASEIVFVGYLEIPVSAQCMSSGEQKTAQHIDQLHLVADRAMQRVAKKHQYDYVDMRDLHYNICDPNATFVRLPGTTKGADWHTTGIGHEHIAKKLSSLYPDHFPSIDPKKS